MNQFLTLLRKDWRLNRIPMVALIVTGIGPYLFFGTILFWQLHLARMWPEQNYPVLGYEESMIMGACGAVLLIALVAATFGGNAFATERRDRSGEFLGVLPVPRTLIVLSKFIVAAGSMLAAWLLHYAVFYIASHDIGSADYPGFRFPNAGELSFGALSVTVAMFGVSWLCSTFLESAAISGAMAFAVLTIAFLTVFTWAASTEQDWPKRGFVAWNCGVGFLTIIVGGLYYMRRVAP